jgi:hypothetical protein
MRRVREERERVRVRVIIMSKENWNGYFFYVFFTRKELVCFMIMDFENA